MSFVYVHSLFAQRFYTKEKNSIFNQYFFVGSIGFNALNFFEPDGVEARAARSTSQLFHTVSPTNVFLYLLDYIKNTNDEKEKEKLKAFLYGLTSHFVLDQEIFRYIIYRCYYTGCKNPQSVFSTYLDFVSNTGAALYHENVKNKIKVRLFLKPDKQFVSLCSKLVYSCAKDIIHSDKINENTFKISYYSLIKIIKMFYFPRELLLPYYRSSGFFDKYPYNSAIIDRAYRNEKYDYLNLQHSIYKDPCTGQVYNLDIYQMMDKAYKKYFEFTNFFERFFNGEDISYDFRIFIDDRSCLVKKPRENYSFYSKEEIPISSYNRVAVKKKKKRKKTISQVH